MHCLKVRDESLVFQQTGGVSELDHQRGDERHNDRKFIACLNGMGLAGSSGKCTQCTGNLCFGLYRVLEDIPYMRVICSV